MVLNKNDRLKVEELRVKMKEGLEELIEMGYMDDDVTLLQYVLVSFINLEDECEHYYWNFKALKEHLGEEEAEKILDSFALVTTVGEYNE